ncbi:MAG: DUF4843 domain-containing protein [Rikenellaceae bacterium]|nr:DUF4843 domain-containing protein [Rikenellaceae bacterium]MCL2692261.1 DUF4843 domain-containing protein [Rikenellaceae bacterium]
MKTIIRILALAAVLPLLCACQDKDIMIFEEGESRVYFEMPGQDNIGVRDSLTFSFPLVATQDHNLMVRIRLLGTALPVARTISIAPVADKTTATTANYSLPATVEMPAGVYHVDVPVTVRRAGLLDKSVRLELEIVENQYFKVGFERGRTAVLVWADFYLKPDNWDTTNYRNAFGEFSRAKFGFILEVCGIQELPSPTDIRLLGYYNALVREALFEYNQANEPMRDENGALLTFPVWSGGGGGLG